MKRCILFSLVVWAGLAGQVFSAGEKVSDPMLRVRGVRAADPVRIVAGGNSEFAFEIYKRIKKMPEIGEAGGNMFFSPYSISTALALTWAGTRGETSDKFARTMHYKLPQEQQHRAMGKLEKQLNKGGKKGGYQLNVANALWGQEGERFREEFLEVIEKNYSAGLRSLDFSTPESAEKARRIINGWVEKKTKDKIKELIGEGVLSRETVLVLTNAIYFKGDWQTQFDEEKTRDRDFHISADKKVQVPMMYLKEDFKYWADEDTQVIELPYKGEHLSMIILLPREVDGLGELEKKLTLKSLNTYMGKMTKQEVSVLLPRFKVTTPTLELKGILKEMGLPLGGDFTGIIEGDRKLFISNIMHKAFVAVDGKGTEAAAATAVGIARTSIGPVFRADHPFMFIIKDNFSGSLLFMGRVINPAEKK